MDTYKIFEGNRQVNEALVADVAEADLKTLVVTETNRRRSRFRAETVSGKEVGVVVGHDLRTGDILATADESAPLLEVEIEPIPALAIETTAFASVAEATALGHAVGNRHWELTSLDDRVLIHADESRAKMVDDLSDRLPPDAAIDWETVPPDLFDREGAAPSRNRR